MAVSFIITSLICGLVTLCYAKMAGMMPVSGAAYTYAYEQPPSRAPCKTKERYSRIYRAAEKGAISSLLVLGW
jgi:hypothetical protein